MTRHMLKDEVADKLTELLGPMTGTARRILEVGTGWGESAEFFSQLKPDWKIYTIDGFGLYGDGRIYSEFDGDKVLKINQAIRRLGNAIQILGDSPTIPWELPLDALFLDGDHTEKGCRADFERFSPWLEPGGLLIFDDLNQPNNPANGVAKVVELALATGKYKIIYRGYFCAILLKTEPA